MTHCFIDTHCHFDFPPFSGEETSSIARAAEAGVRAIIVPAIEAARFDKVLALAREHDALYAALGLHPIVIEHHFDDHLDRLDATLQNADTKLVAIGEIGLDLYREDPQFERQQTILDAQLRLAKRHDLPVILHSRRTHDKLAMHLKRIDVPRRAWSMVSLEAFSRRSVLLSWAIRLASVAPLPIRVPAKPVM